MDLVLVTTGPALSAIPSSALQDSRVVLIQDAVLWRASAPQGSLVSAQDAAARGIEAGGDAVDSAELVKLALECRRVIVL